MTTSSLQTGPPGSSTRYWAGWATALLLLALPWETAAFVPGHSRGLNVHLGYTPAVPKELIGVRSRYRCLPQMPWFNQTAGEQTCEVHNLIILNDMLIFIGNTSGMPAISQDWYAQDMFEMLSLPDASSIPWPQRGQPPSVATVSRAVVASWHFWFNWFHVFAEYLPTMHNTICQVWGDCRFDAETDLQRLRGKWSTLQIILTALQIILATGKHFHDHNVLRAQQAEPIRCLAGSNSLVSTTLPVAGSSDASRALLVRRALLGPGPECRSDHIHCKARDAEGNRNRPSARMMAAWHERLADCTFGAWAPRRDLLANPFTVTIIDRNSSRGMRNVDEVHRRLAGSYPQATVDVAILEGKSLAEQAQLYSKASVLIWMHGASMANLIFLPEGAFGIHIIPRMYDPKLRVWPEELVEDVPNTVHMFHHNITKPAQLHFWNWTFIEQDAVWPQLTAAEQRGVYEDKVCPSEERLVNITGVLNQWYLCEEFWFKTNVDVEVDATELLPYIDAAWANYTAAQEARQLETPEHHRRHQTGH